MIAIKEIFDILTPDEQADFLGYLHKKNRRKDVKNIQLCKLILAGRTKDLDVQLYGSSSKNAYHALSKRTQDTLIDFVANKSFENETSEELNILKLLLASRIFFEHKKPKMGFKVLARAEKMATNLDIYAILTEIYHTKIQYAHLHPELELAEVIAIANTNLKHFAREQQLNMAYALIKERFKTQPTAATKDVIEQALERFDIELDSNLSYKSLFQLLQITVTAARLHSNYYNSAPFIFQLYEIVSQKTALANKHLFYHIEILHIMAVTSFRNKDFKQSQVFLTKMELEMKKQQSKYFSRFEEKLIYIKALLLNYTNKPALAINTLTAIKQGSLNIQLTLAMCYFQQEQYKASYTILKKMQHSDVWYEKKNGWIWVIKKSIIEILTLIELDKFDLVLSRIDSFNNRFSKKLKALGAYRVLTFVKLVSLYYNDPNEVTTSVFKEKVEGSFKWIGREKEDVFVMSFYAWLKAKMEQRTIYEVTLNLVGSH